MIHALLEVGSHARDSDAVRDAIREALIARIEDIHVVGAMEQVYHIDIVGAIAGPTRQNDQRFALAGFPVGQLDAVAGRKSANLKPREVGKFRGKAF